MAVATLLPSATYAHAWSQLVGASVHAALSVQDAGTTRIGNAPSSATDGVYFGGLTGAASIIQVNATGDICDDAADETITFQGRIGGTALNWGSHLTNSRFNTFTRYTDSNVPRPTGGTWTPADFPGGGAGIVMQFFANNAVSGVYVDYAFLSVTYNPAGGGFAFLCGSLAGAALGLAEMAGLARAIHRKTRTLITPDEYREAWREIREYRHPRFFELRGALWI